MKVNGIDERRHHHRHQLQQHHSIVKDISISKTDASIVPSSIVSSNDVATSELQEKLIRTHPSKQNKIVAVAAASDDDDDNDERDGSVSDSGSVIGGNNGFVQRRKHRHANGILVRSYSFDNGKYNSRTLIKSKTIGGSSSIAFASRGGSQKKRNKTLSANGNHCSVDRLDERRTDSKRRRLFHTSNVDQSPLWTTLTHARTMSDFVFDSS